MSSFARAVFGECIKLKNPSAKSKSSTEIPIDMSDISKRLKGCCRLLLFYTALLTFSKSRGRPRPIAVIENLDHHMRQACWTSDVAGHLLELSSKQQHDRTDRSAQEKTIWSTEDERRCLAYMCATALHICALLVAKGPVPKIVMPAMLITAISHDVSCKEDVVRTMLSEMGCMLDKGAALKPPLNFPIPRARRAAK